MNRNLFFTVIMASACMVAEAQVQNTGRIHIFGSSDILYIDYAFTNASTATLTNNGQLYARQNVTNNEVMTVGTGTLYLTGSSMQTISGTQSFKTFNLNTGNAAGILLNANLHVSNLHTFTSGILSSSATPNYLVYEAGSSYTGSGDTRHVSGWVKKFGSTSFAFPVGNGTVERPVSLTNLSATSEFNVRHNVTTPNTANLQSPIVSVDPNEYWTINKISGGTAQVFMNWNRPKIMFPHYALPDIRAVYYTGGLWTNQGGSATGDPLTTGSITSNAMNTFGNFTMGSLSAVLPLHFLSLSAKAEEQQNVVYWKTAEEINVHHFEIQRSADGVNFITVGTHAPNNTPGTHDYVFTDNATAGGVAWYRIRNIDIDGKVTYSFIVRVSSSATEGLEVLNSLVHSDIQVRASGEAMGDYSYRFLTNSGATLATGKISIQQGITLIAVPGYLPKGVYVLSVVGKNHFLRKKIFVQ